MSLRRVQRIFRSVRSLRSPRTLAVLAVAVLAAAWGPSANLIRIAHSPADGKGLPAEVRLVLQAGMAQTLAPQRTGPSAGQRQDAPPTPRPAALLLAISFDGEPPAAPRLSSGTQDENFYPFLNAPSGGAAQIYASSLRVQSQALEAGPEPDVLSFATAVGAGRMRAPRGPPLL